MSRKTISILTGNVSSNALSRAYMIAKLLEEDFNVQIIGQGNPDEIWLPVRNDTSIDYRLYHTHSAMDFFLKRFSITHHCIQGDVIYASKPINLSFGLGLYAKRILGKKLLLDIDDWEIGFLFESLYWEARAYKIQWLQNVHSPLYTRLLDNKIRHVDCLTVSNRFLQKKYGGHWLPHARDEAFWTETLANRESDEPPKVIFLGTPRAHKGLDFLLKAWEKVQHPTARLQIIGIAPDDPLILQLPHTLRCRIDCLASVEYSQVPELLSSAAVAAIPQRDVRASWGQLPMKLIEAMAAGRAIISTAVSDIPFWLADKAGLVIPAENIEAFREGLQYLLEHPQERREMGQRARKRYLHFASFHVVRAKLVALVNDVIANQSLQQPLAAFADSL